MPGKFHGERSLEGLTDGLSTDRSEKGALCGSFPAQGIRRLHTELRQTEESPFPRGEPEAILPWEGGWWNANGDLQTKAEAAEG